MNNARSLLKKNLKRKRRLSFSDLKTTLLIVSDDDLMTQILNLLDKELSDFNYNLDPRRHRFFFTCFEYLEYAPSKISFENENMYHNIALRLKDMLPILDNKINTPFEPIWKDKYENNKEILLKMITRIHEYDEAFNPNDANYEDLLYGVIRRLIFDVKNIAYLKQINCEIASIKRIKNYHGKSLIQELVEHYLGLIKAPTNRYDLLYFEKVINLFTSSSYDKNVLTEIKKNIIELNREINDNQKITQEQKDKMLIHLAQINRSIKCPEIDETFVNNLFSKYMINTTFPSDILKEAEQVPTTDQSNIKDYRKRNVITIDDYHCKAPEDALSIQILPNGHYQLTIYIADVDSSVKHGSILDLEAQKRIFSDANKAVNLFPREFIDRFLSLKYGNDRHVLAFSFEFSDDAKLVNYKVEQAIINVLENLNHQQVKNLIDARENSVTYHTISHIYNLINTLKLNPNTTVSLATNLAQNEMNNSKIGEYISDEMAIFLNSFIGNYFNQNQLPFIFRNDKFAETDQVITDINETLQGTEEAKRLIHAINNTHAPTIVSPINTGYRRLAAPAYGCVTNPLRMMDAYFNQKFIKCYMLNKESEYSEFTDYCQKLLPDICAGITKNNQVEAYYQEDLVLLKREQFGYQKQLTKKK